LLHDEWYVGFHRGLVARFWRAAGASMLQADLEVIARLLPAPPASILDVPCGDGRLALPLAEAGYDVTGIDISPENIEHARGHDAARFHQGDLRDLPQVGRFDAVLSWGNSFGYTTPQETPTTLEQFRRALKPGGRLILESLTVAEAFLTAKLSEQASYTFGDITMAATNRYNPAMSRLESDWRFTDADGNEERSAGAHHVHTTGEVVRMLQSAGFTDIELRGPDGLAPFALGDRRMIAVAV
jgi:2-polyprenyl-3-methyl-5-hydroxy-6-metoxy-1,4-benzoquinol methylase